MCSFSFSQSNVTNLLAVNYTDATQNGASAFLVVYPFDDCTKFRVGAKFESSSTPF